MKLVRPESLAEACAIARRDPWDAKFVSGGTAVVLMMQQGLIAPDTLVSLTGLRDVPGWLTIERDADELRIGGGVTLSVIARSDLVRRDAPSLAYAASVVGNTRVRNVATLGGNVAEADYASDPPAVLVALGATIELGDGSGSRRVDAGEMFLDFYTTALDAGEVVTAVRIPVTDPATRSTYLKYCSRSAEDRPCVGVATALSERDGLVDRLSIAVGAVAGTPQHWPKVTETVRGRSLTPDRIATVAEEYAARSHVLDDARGSAWYRRRMIRVLVRRGLEELTGGNEDHNG